MAAALLVGLALLVVFPPPHYTLWQLSIPVQEWGYWLLPLTVLLAAVALRQGLIIAGLLIAVSGGLLLTPAGRAANLARTMPTSTGIRFTVPVLLAGFDAPPPAPLRLTYAPYPDRPLVLDYYAPAATDGPSPLVVVIHGGGWRAGDATNLSALNGWLAERGFAVAAITYRLAPAHPFPAALDDVRAAISYLEANAAELQFDRTRIALLGRSAGGHLALLAAYTTPDPAIRGVISFYGPTDLVWAWEHPTPERVYDSRGTLSGFLGGAPADRPGEYAAASPIAFVDTAIPTLLVHGARDPLVSVEHSRALTDSLRSREADVTFIEMPWATHGCDWAFNGPCGQISATAAAHFLDRIFSR